MRSSQFGWVFTGAFAASVICSSSAWATGYLDQSNWQAAAGTWTFDDFESWPAGTQLSTNPILSVNYDLLNDGVTYPSVQDRSNTGGPTDLPGTHVFLNDIDFSLPDRGPFSIRPLAGQVINALGAYNVGGDDTLQMRTYRADNSLIESFDSLPSFGFFGIVSAEPVYRVMIEGTAGNQYIPIDNMFASTSGIPEPTTLAFLGAACVVMLRRRAN
ncbi:MAG TPA: PEP-CTERM sorting domain-containing protein [Tepidisphaeraceae bacterium]|nr:PEP-CTERM sorting domain-containing protein [Tepidisphaeraceae bacterium]